MIKTDGKLYYEDICSMLDDIERGVYFSILDVFQHYIDIDSLPSIMAEEEDNEETSL